MENKTSVELLVVLVVERAGESSTAFAEVGAVALVVLVAEAEAAEVSVVPGVTITVRTPYIMKS